MKMPEFRVPVGIGRSDFTEKKSRFIGEARKIASAEEARGVVGFLREEHPRSRHVVWAYVLGADGALKGLSDDGEPHGTAGKPVLDPIEGQHLTNTLVTVVRYFGGVKLGTGGLVSAYGRSCREALETMPRETLVPRTRVVVGTEYSLYERIIRLAEEEGCRVVSEDFGAAVRLELDVPDAGMESFHRRVTDVSRGAADIRTS